MKSSIALGASLLIMLGSSVTVRADHRRQLDDLAFTVLSDSRDIRWSVRDNFTQSSDLRYLCRESDDIFATARNLQDAIFRGRTLPIICRNIESVQRELHEFEKRFQSYDLARHSSHRHPRGHRSEALISHSRHSGPWHVSRMQRRIDQLRQTLIAMHAIAAGEGTFIPQPPGHVDPRPPHVDPPPSRAPHQRGPRLPGPLSESPSRGTGHRTRHRSHERDKLTTFSIGGLQVTLGD